MRCFIISSSIQQCQCGRMISPYLAQIALRRMSSQKEADEDSCGFLPQKSGYATAAVHVAQEPEKQGGAVVPPITMSSTFKFKSLTEPLNNFIYGRLGNPMRDTLEQCLASLEGGKVGFAFASGMGAISATALLLNKGDHLISNEDVYGGTYTLFSEFIPRLGVEVTFIDMMDPNNLEKAIKKNTKMVYFETPTNPSIKVIDIEVTVKQVKKHGNIMVVVDNTFLGSYLQRPLDFGADIVLYSLTKFMNGNSDVILGGAIVNDAGIAERLRFIQRSLETHMQQHIAKKQSTGHSGVFSFAHFGNLKNSEKLCAALKVFTLAVSLGGHESLIEIPSQMTHKLVPEDVKKRLGITDNVIRVSVGLEDYKDLIEDLEQALLVAFCEK
ncbi:cystathionine gamma-lyase-like isoform X3 [Trichoplusia ni]|uniref:cystathionine gamma-lyase n=1 Tax=Trichoplusia ni TaxID=7111 RepID=A0A7E5WFA7_TRINI|nr:cystathionine gamma-lyase-like isoform X3 [Trichoplusia ni]